MSRKTATGKARPSATREFELMAERPIYQQGVLGDVSTDPLHAVRLIMLKKTPRERLTSSTSHLARALGSRGSRGSLIRKSDNAEENDETKASSPSSNEASPRSPPDETIKAESPRVPVAKKSLPKAPPAAGGRLSISSSSSKVDLEPRNKPSFPTPKLMRRKTNSGMPPVGALATNALTSDEQRSPRASDHRSPPSSAEDRKSPRLQGVRGYHVDHELPLAEDFENRFEAPDSDANILFVNGASSVENSSYETSIKGGTLCKLVERLTLPDHGDPTFVRTFLLTYRSFTTPSELLDLLVNRFYCPISADDPELLRTVQKPIRLRLFAVLKVWITGYAYDFLDDPKMAKAFERFCKEEIDSVMPSGSRQLLTLLEKALSRHETAKKEYISAKDVPRPHLPTCKPSELSILTIHPQELARQLTLIEAKLFCEIKPWELLNLAWSRADKEEKAPNVLAMINRSNVVTPWVSAQIVSSKSMKIRVEILTRCIQTMVYLEELHNFNGIMEFLAGLQNAGVYRLKETWARLDKKQIRAWDMLKTRMSRDNNFKIFRESLRTVSPPSIPYLGLFLTDLTFVEEGHNDYCDADRLIINVVKRVQYAQIIKDIQLYQQTPYLLHSVPMIADFLTMVQPPTQEQVYEESLGLKPRAEGSKEVDEGGMASPGLSSSSRGQVRLAVPEDWGTLDYPEGYAFSEPDTDDNIEVDDEDRKIIMYATIPKLVERLTYERYSDQSFVSAFLLTHRLMMPSEQLMNLLIQRYNVPYPKQADATVRAKFEAKVVRPIRLRVFNALKQWVDKYAVDFASDPSLSDQLEEFAEQTMKTTGMLKPAERLLEGLSGAKAGTLSDAEQRKHLRQTSRTTVPTSSLPRAPIVEDTPFLDLPPVEIARQITLNEFEMYRAIPDREVLHWTASEDREIECPNVWCLMEHNTWLTMLTVSLIASANVRSAVKLIEQLIFTADHLRTLNNFNGCQAVMEGLFHQDVVALEGIWVSISSKAARTFDSLKDLMNDIQTYYKNTQWMQKVSTPALPALPIFLFELDRIDQALSNGIEGNRLVHMWKRTQQAKTVTNYLVFQGTAFALAPVSEFQMVFEAVTILSAEQISRNVERINNEVLDDDISSSTSSIKTKVVNAVRGTGVMGLKVKDISRNSGSMSPPSSGASSGAEWPSPSSSPRSKIGERRGTRGSDAGVIATSVPAGPLAAQDWVQRAIVDAMAPLQEEIAQLKARIAILENGESSGKHAM